MVLAATLALAGCTAATVPGYPVPASPTRADPPKPQYYVSLGDSYATGYQPDPGGTSRTTRAGFPYQVARQAEAKGYRLTLVNLACTGATTNSILRAPGCERRMLGPGAPSYTPRSQADAAVRFLRTHRGEVSLITVSIGGNDFLGCGFAPDPASCVTTAVRTIGANLRALLKRLRAATGPATRIVGITYPDIFLGDLATGGVLGRILANMSVAAFKSVLNPRLARTYAAAGAAFVDVTKATGGYGSLKRMTNLPPYGRIPVPVADVCTLTWYCRLHDVHPRPQGHALIARLIVDTLPRR